MTYQGKMQNGVVVFEHTPALPEGTEVRVEAVPPSATKDPAPRGETVWDRLLKLSGAAKGLPADASLNHDHYLYGTPKK
jgi:hypothetical protein